MPLNNEKMVKYCECCGIKIEMVFGGTRFCKRCSKYVFDLRLENHSLKHRLQRKDKIIERLKNDI